MDLLRPFDSDKMKAWRADEKINNVKNTGPELGDLIKGEDEHP
jgi:putative SOS response-associated peptidase YedK